MLKNTRSTDFIRLLGKPTLANVFAGFLAYYSGRAKIRHATPVSFKTLDLRMNPYSWYPERHR